MTPLATLLIRATDVVRAGQSVYGLWLVERAERMLFADDSLPSTARAAIVRRIENLREDAILAGADEAGLIAKWHSLPRVDRATFARAISKEFDVAVAGGFRGRPALWIRGAVDAILRGYGS